LPSNNILTSGVDLNVNTGGHLSFGGTQPVDLNKQTKQTEHEAETAEDFKKLTDGRTKNEKHSGDPVKTLSPHSNLGLAKDNFTIQH
jgi:hypothetical protein